MKKTTLFVLAALSVFAAFSQVIPAWSQKNSDLPASPKRRGILELVAMDEHSLWGVSYKQGSLLGANPEFIRSSDGGNTWHQITSPHPAMYVNGIASVDSLTAYFAICNYQDSNLIVKTIDGGQHWTESLMPATIPSHVYFFNKNEGIVISDPTNGYWTIHRTTDAGNNWTRVISDSIHGTPLSDEFGATFIFNADGDNFWFLTGKGTGIVSRVFYSSNKGKSWIAGNDLNLNDAVQTAALTFRDVNNGLLRVNEKLMKTTDKGISWTSVTISSGPMFTFDMCHVPGSNMYISTGGDTASDAHSRNGIGSSYTIDDGVSWHKIDTGVSHTAIVFTAHQSGWTGGINNSDQTGGVFKAIFATGLDEETALVEKIGVSVYPNPAVNVLNVHFEDPMHTKSMNYSISDLAGKMVGSGSLNNDSQLDISALKPGMYFLNLTGPGNGSVKMIKQ